ncbi:uncharacterized protein FIBRA_01835 [Fibroporia radiculosa]|uniref:DNA-directed RNA polymerase n=1 Tax=Fibroporia radiculosa TaxID=599839 RepID=J4I8Q3_9APHY|nr:uncharacterized protein FIBRA_01835 [Fibroporia radiculosa]CCL99811.1 predicted protein [Fibroporia radiculosa]
METTLLSYSRQNLPRPARLYSTPSKRANAPALATATQPPSGYPPYMPTAQPTDASVNDMEGFLRRRTSYTMLPTPLPDDETNPLNDFYFTDSPTQDLLSVMDACLHNLYDVPRAKGIFERLRATDKGEVLLDSRVYNSFIEAFLEMALDKDSDQPAGWVEDAWKLFHELDGEQTNARPTANTYALMLLAWLRYNSESGLIKPLAFTDAHDPAALLRSMIDRQIPVTLVVSDRAFTSNDEASQAIQALSKAAVEMGLSKIVNELGMAESLGRQEADPLEDVPEAKPVLRRKKLENIQMTHAEDGRIVDIEVQGPIENDSYEIPFNLETLRKHLSQVVFARRVLAEDVAARQKLLEESVYDVAVERLKHQAELFDELGLSNKAMKSTDLRTWMWEWHQKLQIRLKAEIDHIVQEENRLGRKIESKSGEMKRSAGLSPFLSLLTPEKLSLIAIMELMHLQGTGGVADGMKTARALLAVGKAVELEHKAEMCKKSNLPIPTSSGRTSDHSFFTRLGYRDLQARRVAARKFMEDAEDWTTDWTQVVRVKVGSFLVDALMDVATVMRTGVDKRTGEAISEEQPAFFHSYEYLRGYKLGVIKLNPLISEKMAKESIRETLHPRHLPMLVKPKPWLSHDQGGYLYNKTWVMRFKESQEQQSYLRHASSLGNLELIYASLDVLGNTPWKINRRIFDIVLEVWNSGTRWCKIPPAAFDAPEPEKPENFDTDPRAKMIYLTRQKQYALGRANNHSDRCSVNYKIEIARAFLGDTIYFPHNVDFRGRAYPLPPHLSHIGDDLSRGLLMFGEAKPLGERGLRWLKIHLANLYGYDKANFDERVSFVHDHLDDIFDSADNPLEGKKWWTKADDPWQCLATCIELKAALQSPDPHTYECALPVHQDGTCNGLQHYAALGGDAQGARQVNLDVTDRPSDVYTFVAEMVEKAMEEDVKLDHKYAKMLTGKISRKVVKQTVMTTVYGVTFIGAREQIEKQLKDRGDIAAEECWLAASYVAKKVLLCIGDLFKGAKDIQTWLNSCARLIAKSIPPDRLDAATDVERTFGTGRKMVKSTEATRLKKEQMTSVVWTTPLGLPIVQPYRATRRKQIITSLQTVFISDPNSPTSVNASKQASAFPPNFIHSLDATHMMLTALECKTQGVTFASVHDSYWTHPSSIDQMSTIIRDTFIALHSSDVLGKLGDEFLQRYKGYKIPVSSLKNTSFIPGFGPTARRISGSKAKKQSASEVDLADEPADEVSEESKSVVRTGDADAQVLAALQSPVDVGEKKKRGRPSVTPAAAVMDENKFVDLTSFLPPLPQKGVFDVSTIKKSLYFFS